MNRTTKDEDRELTEMLRGWEWKRPPVVFEGETTAIGELLIPVAPDQESITLQAEDHFLCPEPKDVTLYRRRVEGGDAWMLPGDVIPGGVRLVTHRRRRDPLLVVQEGQPTLGLEEFRKLCELPHRVSRTNRPPHRVTG